MRKFTVIYRSGAIVELEAESIEFTDHFVALVRFDQQGISYFARYFAIDNVLEIVDEKL